MKKSSSLASSLIIGGILLVSVTISSSQSIEFEKNLEMKNSADIEMGVGSSIKSTSQLNIGTTSSFILIGADNEVQITNSGFTAFGEIAASNFRIASDKNLKKNFVEIDEFSLLDKLMTVPITSWQFKDDSRSKHIGPMAQDWAKTFGLGRDKKSISLSDMSSVALASIQALNKKNIELENRILMLEKLIRK